MEFNRGTKKRAHKKSKAEHLTRSLEEKNAYFAETTTISFLRNMRHKGERVHYSEPKSKV
jgi:hypothetical protein